MQPRVTIAMPAYNEAKYAGLVQYLRTPDWPQEPERVGTRKATHLRAV